jgi:ABC-type phosphate transport system substrate-binding protein
MSCFGVVKLARPGLCAVLFAGVIIALGLAGLKADGASASVLCNGGNIIGEGSEPQGIAEQNVWIPAFEGEVCNFGTLPKIEYRPQGDVAGLLAWGAFGGAINRTRAFIGTDYAPTAGRIANIKAAAGGGNVLVIPVAQTSIAAIVNPPTGCTIKNITNKELEKSFRGIILEWSELENAEGGEACESPLTRVAPLDASGIVAQFKSYLYLLNGALLPCPVKGGAKRQTWRELSPILYPETGASNTGWPETCPGTELATLARPEEDGDGAEVKKVNSTPGSIGFAALPDAEANGGTVINVQNNGFVSVEEATYAEPQIAGASAGKGTANCSATKYVVPAEARLTGTGLDVDWSQVFGGDPAIGGSAYPLCTLTYDLAFKGYKEAGFKFAPYQTVRDFLNGYVVFGGQTALITSETNYAPLPETKGVATNNVIAAAKYAAALISQ